MTGPDTAPDADALTLRSVGALAYVTAELDALQAQLEALPQWRPARPLLAELAWVRTKLEQLGDSWGKKLVVAIVGPAGAGKSTLLNALAGGTISPVGLTRPTTRQVIAYTRSRADLDGLLLHWGEEDVQVRLAPGTPGLEHLILVDTPDTNTLPENQQLLARVLERADLVLAVFPAQNPKLLDNISFLRPFVRRIPAEAVVPVLNMVDRAPRRELDDEIVPDFREALAREWHLEPAKIYLVSGRSSAPGAGFPADETPLHDLNEFETLRAYIFETLNQAQQVVDRRLDQAEHLLSLLQGDCSQAVASRADALSQARAELVALDQRARAALGEALREGLAQGGTLDLHAALYGALGERWWGPVGWLVAGWGLTLRLGASLRHLGRPGRGPFWRQADVAARAEVPGMMALQQVYAESWPPVADLLVSAGFDPVIRRRETWSGEEGRAMGAHTEAAYEQAMARCARRLSTLPLQALWNAPTLGMIGWVCVQSVLAFFQGSYLPPDYFQHAAIAVATIWAVSFALWQALVSVVVRRGLRRGVATAMVATLRWGLVEELHVQIDVLTALADIAQPKR